MQQLETKSSLLKSEKVRSLILGGAMFLFWAVIFYLSPMTQDDEHFWSYRLTDFNVILDHVLNYGNGRLLGNMGVFYLIEYRALRVLVKAFVLSGICLMLPKVLGLKDKLFYLASFLLVSLCAPKMFAQVFTWTAGFQNFVPCLFLLLAVLCLCRVKKYSALLCLPVFIMSVAMQLYVEHSSVINVLIAMALCVYALKSEKKMLPCAGAFLLGSIIGLGIMLIIPKLSAELSVDMNVYKGIVFSLGLTEAIATMVKQTLVLLARFAENVLLLSGLALCTCLLINRYSLHFKKTEKNILFAALLIPCVFMALAQLTSMGDYYGSVALFETLGLAAATGVWLIALVYSLVRLALIMKNRQMQLALVLLFFVFVAAAPMVFISPIPVRMFLHCYLVASALLLLLLKIALEDKQIKLCRKALALLAVVSSIWLVTHFADINRITNIREDFIANAIENGQYELEYFFVPSDYVFNYWSDDIYSFVYDSRYGIDIKLRLADAVRWLTDNY